MAKDEVELGEGEDEDYEVVPLGPIRKLEKRIDEIETQSSSAGSDELIRDVLDIMKSNQKIVNDMTESTHELKNSVEDLTHKMDSVVDNMNEFMELLTEASEMDMEGELAQDMEGRIADAIGTKMDDVAKDIKTSNEELVDHLEEINQSLRRSYASQNKDNVLSKDGGGSKPSLNPQRGSGQQEQQGQEQPQGRGNGGQPLDQQRGRGQSPGGSSDRMEKLRERFNNSNSRGNEQ